MMRLSELSTTSKSSNLLYASSDTQDSENALTVEPKVITLHVSRGTSACSSFDRGLNVNQQSDKARKINGKVNFGIRLRRPDNALPRDDRGLLRISSLLQLSPKPNYRAVEPLIEEDAASISITSSGGGPGIGTERRLLMLDDMTPVDFRAPGLSHSAPKTSGPREKSPSRISRGLVNRPYSAMSDELKEEVLEEGSIGIAALRSTDSLLCKKWSASGDAEDNKWKQFDGLNPEVRTTTVTATMHLFNEDITSHAVLVQMMAMMMVCQRNFLLIHLQVIGLESEIMYFIFPAQQDSSARNRSLRNCLNARSTQPAVRTARNIDLVKVHNPSPSSAYALSTGVTHTEPLYSPQNFRRQIPLIIRADDFLSARFMGFTDSEQTTHSSELISVGVTDHHHTFNGNRNLFADDPYPDRIDVQVQDDDSVSLSEKVDSEKNRGKDQEPERSDDGVEAPKQEKDSKNSSSDCDVDSADGGGEEKRIERKEMKRRSLVRRPSIIRVDFYMEALESEETHGDGAIKGEGNEEEKLLIAHQLEKETSTEVEPSDETKEEEGSPIRGDAALLMTDSFNSPMNSPMKSNEYDFITTGNGEKESVRFNIPDSLSNVSHGERGGGGNSVHFSDLTLGEGLGKHPDADNAEHYDDSRKTSMKRSQTLRSPTRTKSKDGLLEMHLPELTYKTDTLVIPRSRYTGLVVEGQSQHRCISPVSYNAGRDKGTDERVGGDCPVSASPQIHSPDCSSPSEAHRGG